MERSYHTKLELASALKEILETVPFRKVTISQIADKAEMSRKSFYYHFEDKYDLVKWIFEQEFLQPMKVKQVSGYSCLGKLCHYLYSERRYYRQVLYVTGQNSLSDYLSTYIRQQLFEELRGEENAMVKSAFMADAILVMMKRWLREMDDMNAQWFVCQLYDIFHQKNDRQIVSGGMSVENKYSAV